MKSGGKIRVYSTPISNPLDRCSKVLDHVSTHEELTGPVIEGKGELDLYGRAYPASDGERCAFRHSGIVGGKLYIA